MKILLVYTFLDNPNAYPPLGVVEIATSLKQSGQDVKIHDMTFDKDYEPLSRSLMSFDPDVVGLSVLSICAHVAKNVAKIVKETSRAKVVIGGPHVTATLTSNSLDNVDRVLPGAWKFDPHLIPDRTLLPTMSRYLAINPGFPYLQPWTHLVASRGCPFNCTFCQPLLRKMFGRKVRHRRPWTVIKEILQLKKDYLINSFSFLDDTMLSDYKWTRDFCQMMWEWGLVDELKWTCQTNVRTVTHANLAMMKDAGCVFIGMGVESGSERILRDVYNKPQTRKQIRQAFEWCDELGLMTEATLIIGAPEDTNETINETASLIKEVSPDVVDLHYLTPTPGSSLFDRCKREGLQVRTTKRKTQDRYTPGVLRGNLTTVELQRAYWRVIKAWLSGKSLWRVRKFWYIYLTNLLHSGGIKGTRCALRGLARLLIYHNYYAHRILKTLVWRWRRCSQNLKSSVD